MRQRHAVTKKMSAAYKRGSKSEKSIVLYSPVELTGCHRDHVRQYKETGKINLVRPRRRGNSNRLHLLHGGHAEFDTSRFR